MDTESQQFIRLQPESTGETGEWTTEKANLHVSNYHFDEYNTEVVSLSAEYEHRPSIRDLDWEETHRKWVGDSWKIDFHALEHVVQHLLDSGFPVTIEPAVLRIFIADFGAPFLETVVPSEPPPEIEDASIDSQLRLSDFTHHDE